MFYFGSFLITSLIIVDEHHLVRIWFYFVTAGGCDASARTYDGGLVAAIGGVPIFAAKCEHLETECTTSRFGNCSSHCFLTRDNGISGERRGSNLFD